MVSQYEPPAHLAAGVGEFEEVERVSARSTANLRTGPTRLLEAVFGADARIRLIPDRFLEGLTALDPETITTHGLGGGAVLTIFAPCRPTEVWIGDQISTAEVVAELISGDLHCDAHLFDETELGSCVERHRATADLYEAVNGEEARSDYVAEHFHTVPFDRGGTIVLCRICDWCLGTLLLDVDEKRCGVLGPIDDGFGSVGMKPIPPSEYRWDPEFVRSLVDEFHDAEGRFPTVTELSKTLNASGFHPVPYEAKTG